MVKVHREAGFVVNLSLHSCIHGRLDTTRLTTCWSHYMMSWWYNFPPVPACVRGSDVTQAQAEPCRWHTDRLREIPSKPSCVCGKEGRLMRHVNRCTDQLGDFQNSTDSRKAVSSFLLSVFNQNLWICVSALLN